MRWQKREDDGWRMKFAYLPLTIGDVVVWWEHYYQRFEGLYFNVKTVEQLQALYPTRNR